MKDLLFCRSFQLFSTIEVNFKVTLVDLTSSLRCLWMSKYEIMCLSTCVYIREDQSTTYLINQSIVSMELIEGNKRPIEGNSCSRCGQLQSGRSRWLRSRWEERYLRETTNTCWKTSDFTLLKIRHGSHCICWCVFSKFTVRRCQTFGEYSMKQSLDRHLKDCWKWK